MRERRRLNAWINGAALRDVDGRLHVVNIKENTPDQELTWADVPGRNGQRLLSRVRRNKRITIEFDIRELFDLAARAAIVDAVNAWAADGELEVSYRPEQRMRVLLAKAAEFNGARDVTEGYTVDFDAAAVPYWEDATPTAWALSGTTGSGTIHLRGSAQAQPEIEVTPTGGALNTLQLTFGGKSMSFTNMNVASGTKLALSHDDRGILSIKAGTASKLSARTAASADDFAAGPGDVAVGFTANVACDVVFTARGRYL